MDRANADTIIDQTDVLERLRGEVLCLAKNFEALTSDSAKIEESGAGWAENI
jgi:hypothetical protein